MHYHEPSDFKFVVEQRHAYPAGVQGYRDLSAAVFDPADEVMSVKDKQVMSIAVAATTQCPYCMDAHVKAAKKEGASQEEVARAIAVAAGIRAGGAITHGWLAMKLYELGDENTEYTSPTDVKYARALRQNAGGAVEAFNAFDKAVFTGDDVMSAKTRQLIAVAVAATTQCPYCMDAHVKGAKKEGASQGEVARAVAVAAALRAGAAHTHGNLAMKLYDQD
ncbi:carboxymuconolactone decarboxylase family protein [Granulicoccus phenolivorans]|uniref:carboxymuconolactone decarboxylase family protein n=1 Tax=Granulicoccus phenolivorans TaxID=266854 RepID=UPI0003FFEB6C|nr:carboxymuconolactone decarboxylase family protein [Granulicoccus phenolivorans]